MVDHSSGSKPLKNNRNSTSLFMSLISLIIPMIACILQLLLWTWIKPYVWFLFYPAVFFSSRIGGTIGTVGSSLLSILLVQYFFLPPQFSWTNPESGALFSFIIFFIMSLLFGYLHENLKKANRKATAALEDSRKANLEITRLYEKMKELDQIKSQFFANVSHELRTPLQLIIGPAERRTADKNISPAEIPYYEGIIRNARILTRHVNDILDIARLESGNLPLDPLDINLSSLFRFICSQFESTAADRNIRFTVETHQTLTARCDIEIFKRILINLLSNALKFTPEGGMVRTSLDRENDHIVLKIEDNGPGIPVDMRTVVFERFRQVNGADNRTHGGTGLGLAIVREFALLLEGSAEVIDSELGGACFLIKIPYQETTGPVQQDFESEYKPESLKNHLAEFVRIESEPPVQDHQDSSITVLIVEDNPEMNAFLTHSLSEHYRIRNAFNGQEGLDIALKIHPDLIVTDLMMPQTTGNWLIDQLRANPETAEIPVIVLTARVDQNSMIDMMKCQVQDYLNKPFSTTELLARIDRLLREKKLSMLRLTQKETQYRKLIENMISSYCHCRMIYNHAGEPIDFLFLDVNTAFEKVTGLKDVVGKTICELIPGYYHENQESFLKFDLVIKTGQPLIWEQYQKYIHSWFSISIYSPGPAEFITLSDNITERKEAEKTLRQSEERYRTLFRNMINSYAHCRMIYDESGHPVDYRFLTVNPSFFRITGFPENSEGKTINELVSGYSTNNQDSLAMFDSVIQSGKPKRWEHYLAELDKWYRLYIYTPAPQEFILIADDITERKKSELELQRIHERYELAVNAASIGIWDRDLSTDIMTWNEKQSEIFGYSANPSSHLAKTFFEQVHPDDRGPLKQIIQKSIESGSIFQVTYRFIRPDHELRHIRSTGLVIRDDSGKATHITGVVFDITDSVLKETALKESENKFSTIFHSSPLGIIIANMDKGLYLDLNKTATDMTGYRPDELIGRRLDEIPIIDNHDQMLEFNHKLMNDGFIQNAELKLIKKDGSKLDTLFSSQIVPIGGAKCSITIITDITERIKAEEYINTLNQALEKRVLDAVAEIQKKDVILFQQSRLSSIAQIMTNLAHQWRQPLNTIAIAVQMIKLKYDEHVLNSEYMQTSQDKIMKMITGMSDTINYFTDYLVPQTIKTSFRIPDTIKQALIMSASFIDGMGVQIEYINQDSQNSADDDSFIIKGKSHDLVQVLLNILHNSRDAFIKNHIHQPRIRIHCAKKADDIIISIEDNGGGIEKSIYPRLFEPYVTDKFESQGVGLSLYISRLIIENQFGGKMTASTDKDMTQFQIKLKNNNPA